MNSCNTVIFLATTIICSLSTLNLKYTATDRFENNFSVNFSVPKCMCQKVCANHKFLCAFFFLCLERVRPCLYDVCTRPHGEQLHTTWPPRMRIVPFFRLRNTVKNFLKKSMEISLTLSKIVLLLLKRQYVRMSPNPVYFPSTPRITTS